MGTGNGGSETDSGQRQPGPDVVKSNMVVSTGMSVQRYISGGPWENLYGYSRAVKAGPWIITAGCTATVNGEVLCVGDPAGQTKEALRIALDAIVEAGASLGDVVRTRMYITDPAHADAVGRAHGELFGIV